MKILVCISFVPDTTTKIRFSDNQTKFEAAGVQFITNPHEELGLTRALELKEKLGGATITVLHVGPQSAEQSLRKTMAVGADNAIRINAVPSDAFFVAQQIAAVAKENAYDFIITGKESLDYNGGQVGELLAEFLGWPSISSVSHVELEGTTGKFQREIDTGKELISCPMPFVVSAQKGFASEPRIPSMRGIMQARRKSLKVREPMACTPTTEVVGFELSAPKKACQMIPANQLDELAKRLLETHE